MPSRHKVRANSAHVQSDSERSTVSGSSHASFTKCSATAGGKTGWPPATRSVLQSAQAFAHETVSPLAHDPPLSADLASDGRDRDAVNQAQYDPRPHHRPMGQALGVRDALQFRSLLCGQLDVNRRLVLGHASIPSRPRAPSSFLPIRWAGHILAGSCTKYSFPQLSDHLAAASNTRTCWAW